MAIIRAENHTTEKEALAHFDTETLEAGRETLCRKFAMKAFKNTKLLAGLLLMNQAWISGYKQHKKNLKHIQTRTRRFKKSPIPYLTEILDNYLIKKITTNATKWNRKMAYVDSINIDEPSL